MNAIFFLSLVAAVGSFSVGRFTSIGLRSLCAHRNGNVQNDDKWLVATNGDRVPYPQGTERPIPKYGVIPWVGMEAVTLKDMPGGHPLKVDARREYAAKRPFLLENYLGQWVAVSSKGNMVTAPTDDEVYHLANKLYDGVAEDYCAYCVGSEFYELGEMTGFWVADSSFPYQIGEQEES